MSPLVHAAFSNSNVEQLSLVRMNLWMNICFYVCCRMSHLEDNCAIICPESVNSCALSLLQHRYNMSALTLHCDFKILGFGDFWCTCEQLSGLLSKTGSLSERPQDQRGRISLQWTSEFGVRLCSITKTWRACYYALKTVFSDSFNCFSKDFFSTRGLYSNVASQEMGQRARGRACSKGPPSRDSKRGRLHQGA